MASAVVASTSATTPPSSTAVARSDEGDRDSIGPAAMDTVANAEIGVPETHRRDATTDDKTNHSNQNEQFQQQQQQQQSVQARMQPLSDTIRSEKTIQVGNEYNKLNANKNPAVQTKDFGEGPLPRELRRIIMEVAKTGKCSWLSWSHETEEKGPKATRAAKKISVTTSPFAKVRKQPSAARRGLPPRKRHRNGARGGERMRFGNADGAYNASTNSRKRPLVLVNSSANSAAFPSAPSSVGSGRSTASEPDYDSAPYECDSEGTSATTNSEISLRARTKRASKAQVSNSSYKTTDLEENSVDDGKIPGSPYKTLQTAFRGALGLVLDHFYQNRGNGYKLSPAEKKRNERFAETLIRSDATMTSDKLSSLLSSEYVFQQRRQRLMAMLLPSNEQSTEPPFTIQRIAEVLVAPDRYYTQTHKLCNCIEKLLLVNSSTDSFGGSAGGDTSQRRREERELAALADEKGRQEIKLRQRRIAAKNKSPIDEVVADNQLDPFSDESVNNPNSKARRSEKEAVTTPRELLEALARASSRTRFETDTQQTVPNAAEVRAMAENRRMTNSPPLGLNMASEVASGANLAVSGHADTNGFVRQHLSEQQQHQQDHGMVAAATSPYLYPSGGESTLETTANNMNLLQYHHAAALVGAGATINRSSNATPLDNLMTIDASTISQMRSQASALGTGPGSESTDGRSSASNSDIDSESDDISFDDSASDRSDGSDSGSTSAHHEPFTAARAMVLNRIQQQQRLQNRQQGEGFRPPADSEYQSGDSIDSTRAEDSGGSDSSSSDLAD